MKGFYLDSACEIPVGPFVYYRRNGSIQSKGDYHKGKKSGVWMVFNDANKMTDSSFYLNGILQYNKSMYDDGSVAEIIAPNDKGIIEAKGYAVDKSIKHLGQYSNGKKEGEWTYYSEKGKMVVQYVADSVFSYSCYDKKEKQTKECIYEKNAEHPGGKRGWMNYMMGNLMKYAPKEYLNGELEGNVIVKFMVDTEGNISNVHIANSNEPRLNEAALKLITNAPKWKPGIKFNQIVNSYHLQPVTFARAEEEEE